MHTEAAHDMLLTSFHFLHLALSITLPTSHLSDHYVYLDTPCVTLTLLFVAATGKVVTRYRSILWPTTARFR